MPCWQRVVKKKEEGEEKEGGVDKTLPSGSVDKTQASSSSQKQKREASVDKTEASSSQQLKREASVDKTQASGIAVKAMVADYEEKHIAPPKLKRGPLDGVERMTPALAAWGGQKLKLQARLQQQKEVERIAREAAGVFEPDWDASSSSSSSSPGVQNQKKKKLEDQQKAWRLVLLTKENQKVLLTKENLLQHPVLLLTKEKHWV